MAISKEKRKKMEQLIYDTFSALDPSGVNTEKYQNMFKPMSDEKFDSFFKSFFKSDSYLILDIVEYERELKIEQIEKAAKLLDVPLFEKLIMPNINHDTENPVVTKFEVPVGYLHIKTMQQKLSKKNSTSTDITRRSQNTGQVTHEDKNARNSDQENTAMITTNVDAPIRELLGGRADNMAAKTAMYSEIAKKGYVSLSELPDDPSSKVTLNTLDVYMLGMGINTDLLTQGLQLPKTIEKG